MIDADSTLRRETRALRAVLFAFAVLAQLLLPAIVLRGEALAGDLCFAGAAADDAGSDKSKSHTHEQQCAHCRLQDVAPSAPPPSISVALLARTEVESAPFALIELPAGFAPRVQPPPTGPPTS